MTKEFELRLFVLEDTRQRKKLYFKKWKTANRVMKSCSMTYVGTELFHTEHPLPFIEDWHCDA